MVHSVGLDVFQKTMTICVVDPDGNILWPLDPSKEKRIFDLFVEIGTEPHVDYLCAGGRTRVLDFAIFDSPVETFDLCVREMTEVHRIRRDDELKFSFLPNQSTRG